MNAQRGPEARASFGQGVESWVHNNFGRLKELTQSREAQVAAGLVITGVYLYANRDKFKDQFKKIRDDLNLGQGKEVAKELFQTVKEDVQREAGALGRMTIEGIQKIGGGTLEAFVSQFATHVEDWETQLHGLKGEDFQKAVKDLVYGFMHPEETSRQAARQSGRSHARRVTIVDENNNPLR